jgi:hypothetical protein
MFRITKDNEHCFDCVDKMTYNSTDKRCWYNCETEWEFYYGSYLTSFAWNNWWNYFEDSTDYYRYKCLNCTQAGGRHHLFYSSECCYGLNKDNTQWNFRTGADIE